jgi:cobaltochelatase CobT
MAAWCRAYSQGRPQAPGYAPVAPLAAASRGEGDAQAAWQRWHDPDVDAGFTATEWPWYASMERARVETLSSRHLPGMARNLSHPEALAPTDPMMARLYQAARLILAGQTETGAAILGRVDETQAGIQPRSPLFGLRLSWQPPLITREDTPEQLSVADITAALSTARNLLADGPRFAESMRPLIQALAGLDGPAKPNNPVQAGDTAVPDGQQVTDEEHPDAAIERPGGQSQEPAIRRAFPGYTVFSRTWDEEHPAAHWSHPGDAAALHALDTLDRRQARQLAHRLQRRLLAARLRQWSFDQEEGSLDNRRLARLVGSNNNRRIFRIENEAPVPEACVTLLVDQSGSMRGVRRQMAALAIDLAVHTLELCQVRCEVLGYTTSFGADNPVSRHWQTLGCPGESGRLNALRHIRYKTAEQPWRRARPQLGLLLREGFGHENIDGEALDWAARRLLRQPQSRKVLVVLSDGSPYDEATVSANGRDYLENYLRSVIAQIESSPIHLAAIGTGQDVGRYYRQAVTVRSPEAVAEILFERLGDLLTLVQPMESTL